MSINAGPVVPPTTTPPKAISTTQPAKPLIAYKVTFTEPISGPPGTMPTSTLFIAIPADVVVQDYISHFHPGAVIKAIVRQ